MLPEIDAVMAEVDVPGAAVAVLRDGVPLHARGYGHANLEWQTPVGTDTVFRLASLTKSFTATAILLLEADGRLRLDDRLADHLPGYPAPGRDVTLRQILHHTAGIPNYTALPGIYQDFAVRDHTPEELFGVFRDLPLDFPPGTAFRYSNSGYALLGGVIEARSGMPYADFVRERIFAPLGMTATRYLSDDPVVPHRAAGYRRAEGGYANAPHLSMTVPYSAGALGSTLNDLMRLDAALRRGDLLDHATQARMLEPLVLADGFPIGYGLGWRTSSYRGALVAHHAGGINGFSTFFARFRDGGLTIILLTNLGNFEPAALTRRLAEAVLGNRREPATPAAADPEVLARVAGAYLEGEALVTVERAGEGLDIRGPSLTAHLVPAAGAAFRAADDADTEVRFEGPHMVTERPFAWSLARRAE